MNCPFGLAKGANMSLPPRSVSRLGDAPLPAGNSSTIRVPAGVPSVLQRTEPVFTCAMKRAPPATDVNAYGDWYSDCRSTSSVVPAALPSVIQISPAVRPEKSARPPMEPWR